MLVRELRAISARRYSRRTMPPVEARVMRAWLIHQRGAEVIRHYAEGLNLRTSAERLGVSHVTVLRLRKKFELVTSRGRR